MRTRLATPAASLRPASDSRTKANAASGKTGCGVSAAKEGSGYRISTSRVPWASKATICGTRGTNHARARRRQLRIGQKFYRLATSTG